MSCGSTQCSSSLQSPQRPFLSLQTLEIPAPFAGWTLMCWRVAARFLRLYDRQLQRRVLLELDDRLLADIGLTHEQAEAEGRKPFWR